MTTMSETPPPAAPAAPLAPAWLNRLPSPVLIWPLVMILSFFAVPLFLLFRVSVANRDPAVYEGSGFTLDGFAQLAQPMVLNALTFSVFLALLVATVSMIITFPATYFITRLGRKAQIAWLIGFLSTLALSEVLITFSWQVILSKKAGLSNILVLLGIFENTVSFAPSFGAIMACIVYLVIPFNFMTSIRACRASTLPISKQRARWVPARLRLSPLSCCP